MRISISQLSRLVFQRRVAFFLVGMLLSGFGVALSTLPGLGTSPISSLPRVLSLILPLTLGQWTILSNLLFVVAQIAILKKEYQWTQLSQIPAVFLFGCAIDLGMWLFAHITPEHYALRLVMQLVGCAVLAYGIHLLLAANLTYMPGDGLVRAIAQKWGFPFGTVKICFDCSIVATAIVVSLVAFREVREIREGTLIAAILVGSFLKLYHKLLK